MLTKAVLYTDLVEWLDYQQKFFSFQSIDHATGFLDCLSQLKSDLSEGKIGTHLVDANKEEVL